MKSDNPSASRLPAPPSLGPADLRRQEGAEGWLVPRELGASGRQLLPAQSPRESLPPLCPALPPPGKRDQEANLETGKPRDLARRKCSHLSDRKGLSALFQDEGVCRSLG